jgi:hypothetical protein
MKTRQEAYELLVKGLSPSLEGMIRKYKILYWIF